MVYSKALFYAKFDDRRQRFEDYDAVLNCYSKKKVTDGLSLGSLTLFRATTKKKTACCFTANGRNRDPFPTTKKE